MVFQYLSLLCVYIIYILMGVSKEAAGCSYQRMITKLVTIGMINLRLVAVIVAW